jgi:protein-S-isoprenylcysteine O-methyltransferase Ste14
MNLPSLSEAPWLHVAFASLHVVVGQGVSAWLYRRRYGGSPLVLYRRGQQTRHMALTRAIGGASLLWAVGFLGSAFAPWFTNTWAGRPLWTPTMLAGWVVASLGLAGMLAAQLDMGASFRVGQAEQEATRLVTTGIHGRSRHPIYVASFVCLGGLTLWAPSAWMLGALGVVGGLMHALALTEEAHLAKLHGQAWTEYAARTRRYL